MIGKKKDQSTKLLRLILCLKLWNSRRETGNWLPKPKKKKKSVKDSS